jgi:hypothetical protein
MTPPPITFAGRADASTGHRRSARKRTAPTTPRRVSGPKGGRAAAPSAATKARSGGTARTTARPTSPTRRRRLVPRLEPFAPRRTSNRARPLRPTRPLSARALAYVRALPDHSLLDRIVRGRTWIAMLGVMLVGIVAMQVEELKLGASVGRGLSQSAALQSKNQLLRATVSALGDDQRIERLAAGMGMVMPAPGDVVFLTPHASADAARAANGIQVPNPTSFLASLPQAATNSATVATGLGAGTTAGSTTGSPGTTAGTTAVVATTPPPTGSTSSTGAVAPTGGATTPGTAGTSSGTTGAATPGATAGAPVGAAAAGGAPLAPVTTGNGTTGN